MSIEKISCPRLNGKSQCDSRSRVEAFIKFDDNQTPIEIMCCEYDSENKSCLYIRDSGEYSFPEGICIYKEWKKL